MVNKRNSFYIVVLLWMVLSQVNSAELEGFIPVWTTQLTNDLFTYEPFEYSGCAIDTQFQRIFVANRLGEIISLNYTTGEIQWRFSLKHPIYLSPTYYSEKLFVANTNGEVIALDVSKNRPSIFWRRKLYGGIINNVTINVSNGEKTDGELLLLTDRNTLYVLSISNGDIKLHISGNVTEDLTFYSNLPIKTIGNKIIYALSTGELIITNKDNDKDTSKITIYNSGDNINGFSGFASLDQHIFLSTYTGLFYKIDIDSGRIVWSRNLSPISTIKIDEESNNIFVFHLDGSISIMDKDGSLIMKRLISSGSIAGADIIGNRVLVRYNDGKMFLFAKDGLYPLSSIKLTSPVFASIAHSNNHIYVFTSKGTLIKFLLQ
ncbi:MAG: PQQ-binding-like beta-propeller repeat protein [Deltaproteobacteria bacterium]|nr:PQQ-binding-like beta-propeller repeat protein [Deltaproteobacteria bacterium]